MGTGWFRRKWMWWIALPVFGAVPFFIPSSEESKDSAPPHIISAGLKIVLSKSSLPMAALQDLHLTIGDPVEELRWKFPEKFEILESGQRFVPPDPVRRKPATVKELPPLVIKVAKVVSAALPPSIPRRSQREDFADELNLNRRMRLRLQKVGGVEKILSEPVIENPSLDVMARHLVERELARQQQAGSPAAVTAVSVGAGKVIVLPAGENTDHRQSAKASTDTSNGTKVVKASEQPAKDYIHSLVSDVIVSGHLEMAGGLAYLGGDDKILIYRESEGLFVEEGEYWLRDGRYEISLADTSGILVAQLKNHLGQLIGEGTYDLSLIKEGQVTKGKVEGIDLVIEPLVQGVVGQVVSAYSFDEYVRPVPGAQVLTSVFDHYLPVDGDGQFNYPHLVRRSSYQAKAVAASYWGTLVAGASGHHQQIKLFPDAMIKALIEISLGFHDEEIENLAVIWGRSEESGKPLEGVKVELAGTDLRPIYFNALMIPDRSLRSTSGNGLFAYVGVEPGVHQLRAWHEKRWLPAQVVPTEGRHVSHVVIDKTETHRVPVRVFDAFKTDRALASVMRVLGDDNLIEIDASGYGVMDVPLDRHLMFIEASSFGGYEAVRMIKSRSEKYLHIPMVQTAWLEGLAAAHRLTIDRQKGIIVGFVTGEQGFESFESMLGTDGEEEGHTVLYFGPQGDQVEKSVPGGGFVVFNVEPGLQTVVIVPNDPFDLASRVVFAESGIVSVFQHTFR